MSNKNNKGAAQTQRLLASAQSAGIISAHSSSVLTGSLDHVVIAGAAGKAIEDIVAADVTLVTILLDASSSIGSRGLAQAVRDGYNLLLDTFCCSRDRDAILVALWTFQDKPQVVHSYVPVTEAESLTAKSYRTGGATSLYDTWCDALAANVAYAEQLRGSGTPCRSVVVVITDGEDVCSRRSPGDCAQLSRDLLASEQFVLAFVGVGNDVDFHAVALSMGVPDSCIEVQSATTPGALRATFHMVSQSAIRVSQSVVSPGNTGFFH